MVHLQVSFKIYCLLSETILAREECLFCQTSNTCRSGSGYEPLVTCQTDTSAEKLWRLSLESEDGYLAVQLVKLNINQMKAKESMYHNTCYNIVTRPIREQQPENPEKTRRFLCFEKMQRFFKEGIIQKGHIYHVNEIRELYKRLQEKEGLEKVRCQNRSVKQRLQNVFQQDLSFMSSSGKDEFIICETSK